MHSYCESPATLRKLIKGSSELVEALCWSAGVQIDKEWPSSEEYSFQKQAPKGPMAPIQTIQTTFPIYFSRKRETPFSHVRSVQSLQPGPFSLVPRLLTDLAALRFCGRQHQAFVLRATCIAMTLTIQFTIYFEST